ncbi:MAG TPA: hypothetical protein DEQ30_02330 [Porphyromonadaceae bacterium]|nr:hypothetical protein [Porphyromonadaceae bacterium]
MSKKETVKGNLHSQIDNLEHFIESFSADKIHIAEYNENSTSYLLKSINFENKTCNIEIRRSQGKDVETIPFDDSKVFTIYHSGEICFIPIDGKGLLKTGHCDFVFFNEQYFCFVEMKLNATSMNAQTIEDNRKKAVRQLKHTINYFNTQLSNNYAGLLLEAYIATPDTYPRKDTAFQSIEVQFLEEMGLGLFESREIRYDNGDHI